MRVLSLLPVGLGVLVLCHGSADAGADPPSRTRSGEGGAREEVWLFR